MVKHIVMWQFKPELTEEEKVILRKEIKSGLEGLVGVVPGLLEAEVIINPIESSSHDLALITKLESKEALKAYAVNPDHVKVATKVRENTLNRVAFDFVI